LIFRKYLISFLIIIFPSTLLAQHPLINELMSVNIQTIQDEDGDYPDWLELYNPHPTSIQINGYGLSDDLNEPFKWIMPDLNMPANSHLLIFASDKNRRIFIEEWETIIDWGDTWKYIIVNNNIANWHRNSYNDVAWETGTTGIGYGDGDDATDTGPVHTLYLRKRFILQDTENIQSVLLHIDYDDAFVAYLNGQEVARANIGEPGVMPTYNMDADTWREAQLFQGDMPDVFPVSNFQELLNQGDNLLAISVHNHGSQSSDMSIIPFLSLGYGNPQIESRGANPLLQLESTAHLHTNFKLKSSGELMILSDSLGNQVDQIQFGMLGPDISYGRAPDGGDDWFYFDSASPGFANNSSGYQGYHSKVESFPESGIYSDAIRVELSVADSGKIYYTLNGSTPDTNSMLYEGPLDFDKTTVLRAMATSPGIIDGPVTSHTYIVGEESQLPVISIITEPANLWDWETGIYVMGPNAQPNNPYFDANFWQDWEREVHLQFFVDTELAFSEQCGIKIAGGWSRAFSQKSLALYFRGEYGAGKLDYQLFENLNIDEFNSFSLRNSGNDWPETTLRDALMQHLARDMNTDRQAYRPAVVYLNGEYWGIQNIREKQSEHYIESHHGVDKDSIDFLEGGGSVIQGDAYHYNQLIDYVSNNDMSTVEALEFVKSRIDLDNYLDYMVIQIYCDNTDWPGNNIKFWRPKRPGGKWRWLLYDMDFGFGLYNHSGDQHNTLAFALDDSGPSWPNPPWSTLLFRKLMENEQLRNAFINRAADHLNVSLHTPNVLKQIDLLSGNLADEMPRHRERWNQYVDGWYQNVERMRSFAENRPVYFRSHIVQTFGLPGISYLTLGVNEIPGGKIKINSQTIEEFPWSGYYFYGIPVTLEAIPDTGYYFTGWSGDLHSDQFQETITLSSQFHAIANFQKWDSTRNELVINEINYNSNVSKDAADWLEIVNISPETVDMSGWIFRDSQDLHGYIFPDEFILEPDSFVVIARDSINFTNAFPSVKNVAGFFNFGFSGTGELIRLFDRAGNVVDSLTYDDAYPWPTECDGGGPTLELINPMSDNSKAENWRASTGYGTPGKKNSVYTSISLKNNDAVISDFRVFQNYPNPFNGGTRIRIRIPVRSKIALIITDIQGRQVSHSKMSANPGEHILSWNPEPEISSGIYFYSVSINQQGTFTKRMLYLK